MKRIENILKNKNGITLVALVITIIILIILAGVSLNMLLGENGLIERTKTAKQETLIAQYKEKIDLVKAEVGVKNEGNVTLNNLNDELNTTTNKDWVNNTEVTESLIKLTTNDGYVFFVTASSTEYKGTGDVIVPEIIMAEAVQYTPDPSLNWTGVTNVKQALDYLFNN